MPQRKFVQPPRGTPFPKLNGLSRNTTKSKNPCSREMRIHRKITVTLPVGSAGCGLATTNLRSPSCSKKHRFQPYAPSNPDRFMHHLLPGFCMCDRRDRVRQKSRLLWRGSTTRSQYEPPRGTEFAASCSSGRSWLTRLSLGCRCVRCRLV
jgi:hypothetical protein